jgi:DNA-binding protein HU-beta
MLSKTERQTVRAAADLIRRETDANEKVSLVGFGTFARKNKPARTARNPATGDPIAVPARSVLTFKASPATRVDL